MNPAVGIVSVSAFERLPRLGSPLKDFEGTYGPVAEVSEYRPDLYFTSYTFETSFAKISVTPVKERAANIAVFFPERPSEQMGQLLARYGCATTWSDVSPTDPSFAREFPLMNPDGVRNTFHVARGAFALIQRDVGFGKLVLWIHSESYLSDLHEYRRAQREA